MFQRETSRDEMADKNEGNWLKIQRATTGMSATTFASAIGISRTTLWRYEAGCKSMPNYVRISAAEIAKRSEGASK